MADMLNIWSTAFLTVGLCCVLLTNEKLQEAFCVFACYLKAKIKGAIEAPIILFSDT